MCIRDSGSGHSPSRSRSPERAPSGQSVAGQTTPAARRSDAPVMRSYGRGSRDAAISLARAPGARAEALAAFSNAAYSANS
eukprot:10348175-Alexandrium_andersonii.AAC.1